jgi:hypothetical protein
MNEMRLNEGNVLLGAFVLRLLARVGLDSAVIFKLTL